MSSYPWKSHRSIVLEKLQVLSKSMKSFVRTYMNQITDVDVA